MTDAAIPARTSPRTARITPTLALMVAALLLIAAAVIGVTKSRDFFAERDLADQRASALASGKQLAINFMTLDYRKFDAYSAQVLSASAGTFRQSYAKSLADSRKVLVANHAVASVKQVEAGLVSSDADSARVIVGVVVNASNTATPQVVVKTNRLRLDLQRGPGADAPWKVVNLDFVE
jgi:Mce-associated membrane protein